MSTTHTVIQVPEGSYWSWTDPATGQRYARPVAASDEEKRLAEIECLGRELRGIEHRLAHLDDPVMAHQALPIPAEVERTRQGLVNTKAAVLARLAELEPPPAKPSRLSRKR
jgi:hypothetical protein